MSRNAEKPRFDYGATFSSPFTWEDLVGELNGTRHRLTSFVRHFVKALNYDIRKGGKQATLKAPRFPSVPNQFKAEMCCPCLRG